ncbi:MAG: SDR family NAD(P)-dependent oxidoreductase [Mariprofundales bacterium]
MQLASFDALLDSIPLQRQQTHWTPPQTEWVDHLAHHCTKLKWVGYLSSTSVYGDAAGAWVDETIKHYATTGRGAARRNAERAWLSSSLPAEIFRISGIYGPERNLLPRLRQGDYQTVAWNPPHFSNRIHADDLVDALLAAMQTSAPGRKINVSDDTPFPHADYVQELAAMIHAPAPKILSPQQAAAQLPANKLAFFTDNKRVSNQHLHQQLLPKLRYPSFRQGIASLIKQEQCL